MLYTTDDAYFWADMRPYSGFYTHYLSDVQEQEYGYMTHFMILQDGRPSGGRPIYQVFIYNERGTFIQGVSTPNAMEANIIIIGQELAGSGGLHADPATFTRNIWAVRALGPEYIFWYQVQTTRGTIISQNPPSGSWIIDPTSPNFEGGAFKTSCC